MVSSLHGPNVAVAAIRTITFVVEADARVEQASPSRNYAASALIARRGNPADIKSYLRFTVFGPSGTINSVKLRLYVVNGSNDGPAIHSTGTSWSETGLTWNTQPAITTTGGPIADKGAIAAGSWVEYDLTQVVRNNGTYSFLVDTTSGDDANFSPREGSQPPQLVVTLDGAVASDVVARVDFAKPAGTSKLAVGSSLTKHHLNPNGDPAAVARGKDLMRQVATYQIQPIMGCGTDNPNPSPGVYNWATLDARVELIRQTGGIPVLSLWGAPDWMKGGTAGTTDWSKTEVAPLPKHYDNFANLARQIALRYRDVKHFLVWAELKGFWSSTLQNYDYVAYTTFYNKVYDALKAVDPTIKVGGPYAVIEGTGTNLGTLFTASPIIDRNRIFLQYWLNNKRGADFWAVDRKLAQRADTTNYTEAQLLALTPWFATVTRDLQAMANMPIWFVESYFRRNDTNQQFEAVGLASMLYHQLTAGAVVSSRWSPEQQPIGDNGGNYVADTGQNLFSSTQVSGGGRPLPSFYSYKAFKDHFAPGTQLYTTTSSSPDVEVLASKAKILLINKRKSTTSVMVNNTLISMKPYEVRLLY